MSVTIGMIFIAGYLQDTLVVDMDAQNLTLCAVAIGLKFILVGIKSSMKDTLMRRMSSLVNELQLGHLLGKGLPHNSSSRTLAVRRSSSITDELRVSCSGVC